MAKYRLIVDHLGGYRRGQRDLLALTGPIRFGRHPDSEVAFHARRDIDASAQHASLRPESERFVLVDLGSSNGTLVDGAPVVRQDLQPGVAVEVVFGEGGPRCRLLILGADQEEPDPYDDGAHDGRVPRTVITRALPSSARPWQFALAISLLVIAGLIVAVLL